MYICLTNKQKPCKMKNQENQIGKTIVAFHVGRGGKFNNAGFKSFIGEKSIGTFIDDLYIGYENQRSVYERIENNSILSKFSDEIKDAIDVLDTDVLESFGITAKELGERFYFYFNGNEIISETDVNSGIGVIDIDGIYNTIYCNYVEECSDSELELIIKKRYHFEDSYIYAIEKVGIKKEN